MIIDFTVENFRSIKSEQLLSFYAEKKPKHHPGNIAHVEENLGVLKTAAIYGPNASGKTNLLLAFKALETLVCDSGDWKEGDPISVYEPYQLSEDAIDSPCRFEIEFYSQKMRYRYDISFDKFNILFEKLDVFRTSKASNVFTRTSPTDWRSVKFGDSYKGGKKQFAFFANNSYLSKAGNNPEAPRFIRHIYDTFRHGFLFVHTDFNSDLKGWRELKPYRDAANALASKSDLGISSIEFAEPREYGLPGTQDVFYHKDQSGKLVRFTKNQESRGTNRLVLLTPVFTVVLRGGATLFVDELEASLHPHMAEMIIKLFNDPAVNKNNAQLIYTTHNTALMSQNFLRKDQIFLCAKDPGSGTQVMSLDDFDSSLKDSSPFAKWYDEGRLGGIPKINYHDIAEAFKEVIECA